MNRLKDLDRVTKVVNELTQKFGITAYPDTDFYCYPTSHKMSYALVITEKFDNLFLDYAAELGLEYNVDTFLISVLHEVFHDVTYPFLDREKFNASQDEKEQLNNGTEEDSYRYMRLYDESIATMAAIDYINSHAAELAPWYERLQNELMNFYTVNGII